MYLFRSRASPLEWGTPNAQGEKPKLRHFATLWRLGRRIATGWQLNFMVTVDFPIPRDLLAWIERVSWIELAPGETLPLMAGARVHIGFVVSGAIRFTNPAHCCHEGQAVCLGAFTRPGQACALDGGRMMGFLVKLAGGVAPGVIGCSAEACREQILPLQACWPTVLPITPDKPRAEQLGCVLDQVRAAIARFETTLSWQPERSRHALQLLDVLPVDAAAHELALSRVTFERQFRKLFGLSPKSVMRIQRFYRALEVLSCPCGLSGQGRAGEAGRLGGVMQAVGSGYYDQSHMIAEFRAFTGMTPRRLLQVAAIRPDRLQLYESFDAFASSQAGASMHL